MRAHTVSLERLKKLEYLCKRYKDFHDTQVMSDEDELKLLGEINRLEDEIRMIYAYRTNENVLYKFKHLNKSA